MNDELKERRQYLINLFSELHGELIDNELIPPNGEVSDLFFDFKNALNSYCEACGELKFYIEEDRQRTSEIAKLSKGPYTGKTTDEYHSILWAIYRKVAQHDMVNSDWRKHPPKRGADRKG